MNLRSKEKKIKLKDLGELHQKEIDMLYYIRTRFQYGEIILVVRDGLPYRILKAFESQDL